MRSYALPIVFALGSLVATGCEERRPMSFSEAQEALESAVSSARTTGMTGEAIEIGTTFTIGAAVEDAVDELRAFVDSQAPCTETTVEGTTLTIDYGTLEDACTYRGQTYAGVHEITVVRTKSDDVGVYHAFHGFTNGEVTLDGYADVTWSQEDGGSRHVVHDFSWTDGEATLFAQGDRLQTFIDPERGIAGGIRVEGVRDWQTGDGRSWNVSIDGVEFRGQDPVPQSGAYTLVNPDGKTLDMTFQRLDQDTIEVLLEGLRRDLTWEVTSEESSTP